MTIQSRAAKIIRLAFHKQQDNAEKSLLRRTAAAGAELGLIKEAFGTDGLALSVAKSVKTLARVEQASTVRAKAIAKVSAQLTPVERAVADTMSKRPGKTAWMKSLLGLKSELVAPPDKVTRSAVGKLLRDDLARARASAPDPKIEAAWASQNMKANRTLARTEATITGFPQLMANLRATGRLKLADVVWVSKQTGLEVERVQAILDRLARVAPERPDPLKVTLFQNSSVSASAMGNGQFSVNEGMLRRAKTDDELAWVLGHELAHDVHRDISALELIDQRFRRWWRQAEAEGVPEGVREKIRTLFAEQKTHIRRTVEAQADADGLRYAARAGYDPRLGAEFVERLRPKPLADAVYVKQGYPPPRKRAEAMKAMIEQGRL
jgi:hypothetical protein